MFRLDESMKKELTLTISLLLVLVCVGTVAGGSTDVNLLTNGGFESPQLDSGAPGQTISHGLTGWNIESGNIDLIHSFWTPKSGNQSIDLVGTYPGTISQTINTVPGATYTISFRMAGNPDAQEQKVLGVYWDGNEVGSPTFDTTGKSKTDMGWTFVAIPGLTATKTTTKIAFKNIASSEYYGVALDDISVVDPPVTPAPEFPGTAFPAVMLVGFMGFVLYVQKSRKD